MLDTAALLTREVSIDHVVSEILFYHYNFSMRSGRNWKQNMLKVSKLSLEKGCLC